MGIEWEGKAVVANIVCGILSFSHGTYCHGFTVLRDRGVCRGGEEGVSMRTPRFWY